MDEEKNYQDLKSIAQSNGAIAFGVGYIEDLKEHFPLLSIKETNGLKYGIAIAVKVNEMILKGISDHPTKLYLHHYKNLNYLLDRIAIIISGEIERRGYKSLPIPASQIVDWEKQRGHLSHKMIAKRAGLGFIGRNNLLVHNEFGAKIRLVSILTNIPLKTDKIIENRCIECRKCIEICPANALGENPWDYNLGKCLEKLKFFQKNYNIAQYICGLCVKVCNAEK